MKPFELLLQREIFNDQSTRGQLHLNGEYFCFTLEDKVRGPGVKIPGKTAIPAGRYRVKVTWSQRFQREMPILYNQENGYEIIQDNVSFRGVRLHGGNTHLDTHGCSLVAFNAKDEETIYQSAEKSLTARLKALGGEGFITIQN